MGDHEEWSLPPMIWDSEINGILPNTDPFEDSSYLVRLFLNVEERMAELISCIQPNQQSEERRKAVADYVETLIIKCFPCQVFTLGSGPLKTYLPDGDINLTVISRNADLKDSWASEVRDMLETEENKENAKFHVSNVEYIQSEADNLINKNHLFKRSIILIKAWCYYESRILGAHYGLISNYALQILVLYIFHVFNNSFTGPFEVLFRFLEFFSKFDWENYCLSLWGPVPMLSLPDLTTVMPPRKDYSEELLLKQVFLFARSSLSALLPDGLDNQWQTFESRHLNVIDPFRDNNNLGHSVSKGNFFRIRSAFAFGANRLSRLLMSPEQYVVDEVNQFFRNTWDRHGSGIRPDADSCV